MSEEDETTTYVIKEKKKTDVQDEDNGEPDYKMMYEDLKAKLEIIAEKEFEKKRQEVGAPESVDTPEKLQGFIQAKEQKLELEKQKALSRARSEAGPKATGQAKLPPEDLYNPTKDWKEIEYDNPQEFVGMIRSRIEAGDSEAEDVLNAMLEKALRNPEKQSGKAVIGGSQEIKAKRRRKVEDDE